MEDVLELTASQFRRQVLESPIPVLVEFWAEWCPPCKLIFPILEELAADNQGAIRVVRVNTDDEPDVAARYQVTSIPTILLFTDGELRSRHVGAAPKPVLRKILDSIE